MEKGGESAREFVLNIIQALIVSKIAVKRAHIPPAYMLPAPIGPKNPANSAPITKQDKPKVSTPVGAGLALVIVKLLSQAK
jgi:hypothetical protein